MVLCYYDCYWCSEVIVRIEYNVCGNIYGGVRGRGIRGGGVCGGGVRGGGVLVVLVLMC